MVHLINNLLEKSFSYLINQVLESRSITCTIINLNNRKLDIIKRLRQHEVDLHKYNPINPMHCQYALAFAIQLIVRKLYFKLFQDAITAHLITLKASIFQF